MRIESARALKLEMAATLLSRSSAIGLARSRFGVAAVGARARAVSVAAPFPPPWGIALGIAAGRRRGDVRIAVRVRPEAGPAGAALRADLERMAAGEVDFRHVGRIAKLAARPVPWRQGRRRPLAIGVSAGHVASTAGTLGAFVRREAGGVMMLSNSHVFADEGRAAHGDAILQPAPDDRGRPTRDRVGALEDFVPFSPRAANPVDAAVPTIAERVAIEPAKLRGLGLVLGGLRDREIEPDDAVAKIGRTTGVTRGIVTAVEMDDVEVDFDVGRRRFDDQIEIEGGGARAFCDGGDSGSLIVDADGFGCGLLFAGSDEGGRNGQGLTYANPLSTVLRLLKLELVSE